MSTRGRRCCKSGRTGPRPAERTERHGQPEQAEHERPAQRVGQRVVDPAHALRELQLAHGEVNSWIVLSHSGFEEDLRLAHVCPFIDVIFAGLSPVR